MGNQTGVLDFLLLGLSDQPEQQQFLFRLFLVMYFIGILGNLLTILAICFDSHLHTPMYFFLSNLSFLDLCFTSTTVPKMLVNYVLGNNAISYPECLTQMYFYVAFGGSDSILLSVMAYDRYLAVCHPLHYGTVMTSHLCALLVAVPWVSAHLIAMVHSIFIDRLSFCMNNKIPHFFCDINALIKLSCSDAHVSEMLVLLLGGPVMFISFICIVVSYTPIILAVWKVSSTHGKWKAFSTCGSHLSVVCLFYGTIIGVYFNPTSTHTAQNDMVAIVMYTVVAPTLNPFIYSLRNNELKGALGKLLGLQFLSTEQKGIVVLVGLITIQEQELEGKGISKCYMCWGSEDDRGCEGTCSKLQGLLAAVFRASSEALLRAPEPAAVTTAPIPMLTPTLCGLHS
ncbi:olfactory receptor 1361-like [Dromiciops gliroides]|uniref:olfactory receptor 1361-like n=1 Tax=Dromiciops gliroides TaxID=33562 RepID=UPI001CC543AC|nr:olfactory receptor 1361-like [Dromiciops gliroides]